MKILIEDCLSKAAAPEAISAHRVTLTAIFDLLSSGLSYQYNRVWKQILGLWAIVFKVAGPTCGPELGKILVTLAELRDSYNFPCVNEVDYALGAAVR